jgi:hypothetical protein
MTRFALLITAALIAQPARATDAQTIYQQISTDVTCSATQCTTLSGWRGLVAQSCKRFQSPNAPQDQAATFACSDAQFGLMAAVTKANSYGWGTFTDRTEPAWFHALARQ